MKDDFFNCHNNICVFLAVNFVLLRDVILPDDVRLTNDVTLTDDVMLAYDVKLTCLAFEGQSKWLV